MESQFIRNFSTFAKNSLMKHNKSLLSTISILLLIIVVLSSCNKKKTKTPDSYFKVGETVYELKSGTLINKGEVSGGFDIDLRLYCENNADFISFRFVSEQAESLLNMTHNNIQGSWVLGYNEDGSYTNMGTINSGSLVVNRNAEGYTFEFNCTDQYNNTVNGVYKGNISKKDENILVHQLPNYVLPNEIYDGVTEYFPIHAGVNPPDIKGEYVSAPHAYVYNSHTDSDTLVFNSDRYLGFIYNNNQLNFYGKQYDSINGDYIEEIQYGVKITGDGDDFTCYYVVDGYPNGYYAQQSFIFSGTKTPEGLKDFFVAVVLLEKSGNPSIAESNNSYRILKDYDGLAEEESWLSKKGTTSFKAREMSDEELFDMWIK